MNKNNWSIIRGGNEFRLNNKVMQIKNNYDKDVFNGDIGIISEINLEDNEIMIDFDNRLIKYDRSELDEIVLSYAITIHKSQGSEYPIVIMPLAMSHFVILQRNLLYAVITRAQKLLILIESKK